MDQLAKANAFRALHRAGNPVVLYNIWDAGGAGALEKAGATALATGSKSVALAQGYSDGEQIPLGFVLQIVARITASTKLPVSVDFEGGYALDAQTLGDNVKQLIAAGAIGLNFEDQIVGGTGLHSAAVQAQRIAALRAAADETGIPLFINARTDLFLKAGAEGDHAALLAEAIARAEAYTQAGADGIFVPGLWDTALIAKFCQSVTLPVNVMLLGKLTSQAAAAAAGAARVSYGPGPYFSALEDLTARFNAL